MITIEVRPAQLLPKDGSESLFISFPYSLQNVDKVKSLPNRRYVSSAREWEVPVRDIDQVTAVFADQELTMKCQVVTQVKEAKAKKNAAPAPVGGFDLNAFQFKTKPFDHQVEVLRFGADRAKFLLGDEQGLGKTKESIDLAIARKQAHKFKHCLIVCGINSVKHNWYKEVEMHSNEKARVIGGQIVNGRLKEGTMQDRLNDLKSDMGEFFLIMNVESLRDPRKWNKEKHKYDPLTNERDILMFDILTQVEKMTQDGTIGMVIVDEVQKCKNSRTQQGKALKHLKAHFRLPMTGTPLMNRPEDLYNILYWVGEETRSEYQFKQRYCVFGGFGNKEVVGYQNLGELQQRLNRVMLRRLKKDVLNLPPKIRSTDYVEMTAKQAQVYKDVLNATRANIDQILLSPNPLAQLTRLRQATGHTGILSSKVKESAKLDRLKELLEEIVASGKKAIVFSNWTEVTDRIVEGVKEYHPAVITGDTKDVEAEKDRFQNDPKCGVCVGTIGKMGTGHTLTAAEYVIFFDKPWNRATTEQAEDRAHRIGTTGTVNIISLVCVNTIDEKIEAIIEGKGELADALVDGDMDKLAKLDPKVRRQMVEMLLSE